MEEIMKKQILKVFLSLCFMIGSMVIGTRQAYSQSKKYKIENNEYLELKSKITLLDVILNSNVKILSEQDQKYYLKLKSSLDRYPQFIYNMKDLAIEQLKKRNYTASQIEAIKTYDGSNAMTVRAAAIVIGSYNISDYRYDSSTNLTYATGNATVTWQGTPFFQLVDQFAIALSASTGNFIHLSSSCTATYKGYNSGKIFTQIPEKEIPLTTYVKFKIPRERYSSKTREVGGLVKVSGKYTAAVPNRVDTIAMRPCYAHRQISGVEGGLFLSSSGLSLSFDVTDGYVIEWYPIAKTAIG